MKNSECHYAHALSVESTVRVLKFGSFDSYAHDTLTSFMTKHGFTVTRHYLGLKTAWRAEFSYGKGGRVIGLQSEMDALPNIGHACGHNLIAILGVAVALGLKAALKQHQIAGRIVLLGTPGKSTSYLLQTYDCISIDATRS